MYIILLSVCVEFYSSSYSVFLNICWREFSEREKESHCTCRAARKCLRKHQSPWFERSAGASEWSEYHFAACITRLHLITLLLAMEEGTSERKIKFRAWCQITVLDYFVVSRVCADGYNTTTIRVLKHVSKNAVELLFLLFLGCWKRVVLVWKFTKKIFIVFSSLDLFWLLFVGYVLLNRIFTNNEKLIVHVEMRNVKYFFAMMCKLYEKNIKNLRNISQFHIISSVIQSSLQNPYNTIWILNWENRMTSNRQ